MSKEARTPTGRLAAGAVVLLVGGQRAALPAMIGPSSLRAVMMTESRGNGELTSWTYASYHYRVYLLPLSILLSSFLCYLFLVDRVPIETVVSRQVLCLPQWPPSCHELSNVGNGKLADGVP